MKKKIITLYVDDELIEKAKSKGLNLSGFLGSKLREFITFNPLELRVASGSVLSNNQTPVTPTFSKHKRDYEK